jgi:Icc-related predicted phosphoesterase
VNLGLPRVRLLQIGDLHLPTAAQTERTVDQKDRTFSYELRNVISRQPIKTVFKRIYRMCEAEEVDGVLLMGDMTDFGMLDGYKAGVSYVANALQLGSGRKNESTFCGIVPGNHDIDRALAKKTSMTAKFKPLNAALDAIGLGQIPVDRSIVNTVRSGEAKCAIVLMNSCWGCGAVEYIPSEFREGVGAAIEAAIASGDSKVLSAYYDRQFDTPAFSDSSISQLVEVASSLAREQQLVVVAHHNLLPQRLTRLAPYTELVNSGAVRSSLMEAKRPILYLHGHIHTDPVEVLSVPGGDVLVCISAPAAEAGFNIIEIVFTRSGNPLVAHVIPWTFDKSAVLREGHRLTVPLIGKRRRSLDGGLAHVYSYLLGARQCYWSDLHRECGQHFQTDVDEQLQECVELLLADQSITVENYEGNTDSWILEAQI